MNSKAVQMAIVALVAVGLLAASAAAQVTWTGAGECDQERSWGNPANWAGCVIPPGMGQVIFGIYGDGQIDLDGTRTIGRMAFENFTTTTIAPGDPANSVLRFDHPQNTGLMFIGEGVRQTYCCDYFTAGPQITADILMNDPILYPQTVAGVTRSAMLFSGQIDNAIWVHAKNDLSPNGNLSLWFTADNSTSVWQAVVDGKGDGTMAINLADEGRIGSIVFMRGSGAGLGLLQTNAGVAEYANNVYSESGGWSCPVIYADRSYQLQAMPANPTVGGGTRKIKNVELNNTSGDSAIAFGGNGLWLRTNNGCIIEGEKLVLGDSAGSKTVFVNNGNWTDGLAGHRYMGGVNNLNISMNEARFTGDAGGVGIADGAPNKDQTLIKRGAGVLALGGNNDWQGYARIEAGVLRFQEQTLPIRWQPDPNPPVPGPATITVYPDAGFGWGSPTGQFPVWDWSMDVPGTVAGQSGAFCIDTTEYTWPVNSDPSFDRSRLRLGSSSREGGRIQPVSGAVEPHVVAGEASRYYLGGGGGTLNIDVTLGDFSHDPDYGIGPTWLEMGTTGQLLPGRVVLNHLNNYTGRTDIRAGTLEPNNTMALFYTTQINVMTTCTAFDGAFHNVVSPFSFAGPGQLLLHPGMNYQHTGGTGSFKPRLYGGAVGWTGDKTLDSLDDVGKYAGTLSVSMDPAQCNEQDTYLLHLGGEYSEGTMTVAPTFVITDNGATPVALVKSGTGSILDLTACPINTYTGGTAIIGGKVIVSEPNQVGTGPILVANGGRLHVTESGTYGNTLRFITEGTPSQLMCNGSVVEVDGNCTATFTGRVKVRHRLQGGVSGSVETVFEKLGQGTMSLDYRENGQPAAYPSDLNNVWGVKLTEGLLSTNQLCFLEDARTGGYLVCLGGDMEVRPTPVPLENYKDGWQDYGFAGFVSFKDTVSKITVQDGNDALFRVCNWVVPNEIMGTVIFDVPEGDTDGSNNRFHLRCGHVDNFLQYQARGTGTVDVRGGMVLLTSDAGVRVLPQEAGFTIKLNGGRFNGIPEADLNGNLIINDLDAGGTAQVDGAEAQWDWDGPLSPTVWTIGGTGTTSWGGTLEKVGDGQVFFARSLGSPVTVGTGAALLITSGTVEAGGSADPFTDTLDPTRHVDVVNNSMFVVSSGTKEVGHLVGNGQLDVNPNAHLFNNNNSPAIEQAVVNVLGQLTIREYAGPGGDYDASRIETLVVDPDGRFNLTNNALVIGTGSRDAVRDLIVSGYNSGAWGGLGICTDSTVPGNSVGLGYAAGNDPALDPLAWQFHGQGFDADSVLVLFTVLGDADLDGDVDGPDVARWAVNFTGDLGGGSLPSRYWTQGDWDYDGDVDADDVNQWASNFEGDLTQLVVDAPGAPPEAVSTLGDMGVTVVPEPATLSLLALGALAVIRRKRQNVACCWSH